MTEKTTVTGTLATVSVNRAGQYLFDLAQCDVTGRNPKHGPSNHNFLMSDDKALAIANSDGAFPTGVRVKVTGRFKPNLSSDTTNTRFDNAVSRKLTHVKIISVDGVEVTAWSQRVGSTTDVDGVDVLVRKAEEAEKAMVSKAPPEQPGTITDPTAAYENAMRIVRRQRKLKNPKLSQQEIWQVRDALNLLAEKLGIA
jgi:hypothetical protein